MLITADRVWDGVAARPIDHGFVSIGGDRIVAVGRQAELARRADGEERVDLGDATLLPGLINGHVHLALAGTMTPIDDYLRDAAAGPAALTLRAVANLEAAARVGVTTVRDLGSPNVVAFAVREAAAAGLLPLPRVLTSGEPLTITGGHCHWFSHQCDDERDVRRAVRHQVAEGADLIKIFATGGNLTPRTNPFEPQFTLGELEAATAEARRLAVPVAAHAHAPEGIRRAVAAGVSTIEHCFFETAEGVAYDPAAAEAMARSAIAFCPTIGAGLVLAMDTDPELLPPVPRRLVGKVPALAGALRGLLAAGAPLLAGSDAGAIPGRTFDAYPADVAAMTDERLLGLSPRQALVSATSGAAAACGLADTGTLGPGRRADLLAVDGDPLRTIADLERTRMVLVGGRRIAR